MKKLLTYLLQKSANVLATAAIVLPSFLGTPIPSSAAVALASIKSVSLSATPTTILEGETSTLTAMIELDPSTASSYFGTVNCANGEDPILLKQMENGKKYSVTCSYPFITGGRIIYNAQLDVYDKAGANVPVATTWASVTVKNNVPAVSIAPANPTVPEGTAQTLTASVNGGNAPFKYNWSGDCSGTGQTSTAPSTVGVYTCKVDVGDKDGDKASASTTVTVTNNSPIVSITPANSSVPEGTSQTLTANVIGGNNPISFAWSGDCSGTGPTSTAPSTVGTYTCSVTVTDKDGDTASASTNVTVTNNAPAVSISPKNPVVYEGTAQKLTATATGGNTPYTYQWSNSCSGTKSYAYAPKTVGVYTCKVTVTDSDGDTASESTTITVKKKSTVVPPVTPPVDVPEEDIDDTDTTDDVLGEETCSAEYILSGYVFTDTDGDGEKDGSEKGVAGVDVDIYIVKDGQNESIETVTTDSTGYWKLSVCPGTYSVRLDTDTLPENKEVADDEEITVIVEAASVEDVNFALDTVETDEPVNESNTSKLLLCLIPLIAVIVWYLFLATRKKKNDEAKGSK